MCVPLKLFDFVFTVGSFILGQVTIAVGKLNTRQRTQNRVNTVWVCEKHKLAPAKNKTKNKAKEDSHQSNQKISKSRSTSDAVFTVEVTKMPQTILSSISIKNGNKINKQTKNNNNNNNNNKKHKNQSLACCLLSNYTEKHSYNQEHR